jgi:hypothetical protein
MSRIDRLFYRPEYRSTYQPTHDGIHGSLVKYAEEHADESLEHLKLEPPTLKEIKKTIIAKTRI